MSDLDGYTLVKVKDVSEKPKLQQELINLKKEIKTARDLHDSEMRVSKQKFEEYKGSTNAALKIREGAVKKLESEIASIERNREIIKKEKEQIDEKWNSVNTALDGAEQLKISLSVKEEEAAKIKELYESKLENLA